MTTTIIGATRPYVAANGHTMAAPIHRSCRTGRTFTIYAEAWCTDSCRACAAGGDPSDYCGETE